MGRVVTGRTCPSCSRRYVRKLTETAMATMLPSLEWPGSRLLSTGTAMRINSLDDLLHAVQKLPHKRLAVAWANDAHTLEAVNAAVEAGLVEAILVGDEAIIRKVCQEQGFPLDRFRLIPAATEAAAAARAVALVRSGEADLLMKGLLST